MRDKFILEIYDDDGELVTSNVYKSFRQIQNKTGIEYHNCRTIYSICSNDVQPKFLHKTLQKLLKRVKIKDISTLSLI